MVRWKGGKGGRVVRQERWEVPGFIPGWGTEGKFKISAVSL